MPSPTKNRDASPSFAASAAAGPIPEVPVPLTLPALPPLPVVPDPPVAEGLLEVLDPPELSELDESAELEELFEAPDPATEAPVELETLEAEPDPSAPHAERSSTTRQDIARSSSTGEFGTTNIQQLRMLTYL